MQVARRAGRARRSRGSRAGCSGGRSAPSRSRGSASTNRCGRAAGHVDRDAADLAGRERAQQLRHLARDAGAHQHVVDAAEHRAEQGRGGGQLDLLEAVDADDAVVALLGQPHLGEVADHGELLAGAHGAEGQLGQRLVGRVGAAAALDEVGVEHPLRHGGAGEVGQRAAVVPALVAVLQAAGEHGIHRGAGHDAEVTGARDLAGQAPARDRHAHPALDDRRAGSGRGAGLAGSGLGGGRGHGCHLRLRATYVRVGFVTVSYGSVGSHRLSPCAGILGSRSRALRTHRFTSRTSRRSGGSVARMTEDNSQARPDARAVARRPDQDVDPVQVDRHHRRRSAAGVEAVAVAANRDARADGPAAGRQHPAPPQPGARLRLHGLRLARPRPRAPQLRGVLRERRQGGRRGGHEAPRRPGLLRRAPRGGAGRPGATTSSASRAGSPSRWCCARAARTTSRSRGTTRSRSSPRRCAASTSPGEAAFYTSGRASNEAAFTLPAVRPRVRHQQPAGLLEHVPRVDLGGARREHRHRQGVGEPAGHPRRRAHRHRRPEPGHQPPAHAQRPREGQGARRHASSPSTRCPRPG